MFLNLRTWGFVWDKDLLRGIMPDLFIHKSRVDPLMTSYNLMLCLLQFYLYSCRLSVDPNLTKRGLIHFAENVIEYLISISNK